MRIDKHDSEEDLVMDLYFPTIFGEISDTSDFLRKSRILVCDKLPEDGLEGDIIIVPAPTERQ